MDEEGNISSTPYEGFEGGPTPVRYTATTVTTTDSRYGEDHPHGHDRT
ncbi:hypothetical protein CZ674_07580 [Agrococcus casei LMG 22410]|uniref:Uncharacterized protein n=1 Tax=Agrococcus casei LMG 22410 TaxID=1255656 RepID=A0A1R4FZ86_9MICO|nr:hypothetical protein CZ674_07580 [Agrococcus casei LMG 22410]